MIKPGGSSPRAGGSSAPASPELTSPVFWEDRHRRQRGGPTTPLVSRRHLDFELDRFFRRHLPARRGGAVVEVGCGASIWLPYFVREFGLSATGLDYSPAGLSMCRSNLAQNGAAATLVLADIQDPPPLLNGAFDAVFSLGFIEHFAAPAGVIARMVDFLRPGGLFLAWIPNTAGLAAALGRRLNPGVRATQIMAGRDDWTILFEKAGLRILEAYAGQFFDLSHVNVLRLPLLWQKLLGSAVRVLSLPLLFFERISGLRLAGERLCSGLFFAARKPGPDEKRR